MLESRKASCTPALRFRSQFSAFVASVATRDRIQIAEVFYGREGFNCS